MSRVRMRRLKADYELLDRNLNEGGLVRMVGMEGDPPERYRLEYLVWGLVAMAGKIMRKRSHMVEVYLPLGYPRQGPQCRMLTPVFHPNIAPHAICIGDHWSAGESLLELVLRIGEMLTYQSYNLQSPLNKEAAKWAAENVERLPIHKVDMTAKG